MEMVQKTALVLLALVLGGCAGVNTEQDKCGELVSDPESGSEIAVRVSGARAVGSEAAAAKGSLSFLVGSLVLTQPPAPEQTLVMEYFHMADSESVQAGKSRYPGTGAVMPQHPATDTLIPHPSRVTGSVNEITDTASLVVDGHPVILHGIARGTREPYVSQLRAFLLAQGDTLKCLHVEHDRYRCEVRSLDLASVLLLNGAARAEPDAHANYLDKERLAQENVRGVWAR